jgi:hypothetical protein
MRTTRPCSILIRFRRYRAGHIVLYSICIIFRKSQWSDAGLEQPARAQHSPHISRSPLYATIPDGPATAIRWWTCQLNMVRVLPNRDNWLRSSTPQSIQSSAPAVEHRFTTVICGIVTCDEQLCSANFIASSTVDSTMVAVLLSEPLSSTSTQHQPSASQRQQHQHATNPPSSIPYPYGQLPSQSFQPGRQIYQNQHPLPGSFNRQSFNPKTQAFIPSSGFVGNQTGAYGPQPYPVNTGSQVLSHLPINQTPSNMQRQGLQFHGSTSLTLPQPVHANGSKPF